MSKPHEIFFIQEKVLTDQPSYPVEESSWTEHLHSAMGVAKELL